MNFLNLFKASILKVEQKQKKADEQLYWCFFESYGTNNQKSSSEQRRDQQPKAQQLSKQPAKHESKPQSEDQVTDLSFFEIISRKNDLAFKDFYNKINLIKIGTQTQNLLNDFLYSPKKQYFSAQKSKLKPFDAQYNQNGLVMNPQNLNSLNSVKLNTPQESNRNFSPYKEKLKLFTQSQNSENILNIFQEKQKTAIQILAELQQIHRQKSIEREGKTIHKSLNKRTRVTKMNPEMSEKMKQQKQKQAQERIKVNLEFLQNLKIKPQKQAPSFKEFKNDSLTFQKLKQSIRIKTIKKTALLNVDPSESQLSNRYANRQKLIFSMSKSLGDSNIFIDSPLKLPPIESKRGTLRPKPYSVYSVYQKGNQMFINSTGRKF